MKNPEYDLPNLHKEIKKLAELREEKSKLYEELAVYQGLQPDLMVAKKQLAAIKSEYDKTCSELLENCPE